MRRHHHRRAGVACLANRRHRSADARIFGDIASIVLRHIQIGANEDALALQLIGGDQIAESVEFHFSQNLKWGKKALFYSTLPAPNMVFGGNCRLRAKANPTAAYKVRTNSYNASRNTVNSVIPATIVPSKCRVAKKKIPPPIPANNFGLAQLIATAPPEVTRSGRTIAAIAAAGA